MMVDEDVALEHDSVTQSEYNKSTTAIRFLNIKKVLIIQYYTIIITGCKTEMIGSFIV